MSNVPGTYVKEGKPNRQALTPSEAVALSFDGYTLVQEPATEAPAKPTKKKD